MAKDPTCEDCRERSDWFRASDGRGGYAMSRTLGRVCGGPTLHALHSVGRRSAAVGPRGVISGGRTLASHVPQAYNKGLESESDSASEASTAAGGSGAVPRPMPWHFDVAAPPARAPRPRPRPKERVIDESPERRIGEGKTTGPTSEAVAQASLRRHESEQPPLAARDDGYGEPHSLRREHPPAHPHADPAADVGSDRNCRAADAGTVASDELGAASSSAEAPLDLFRNAMSGANSVSEVMRTLQIEATSIRLMSGGGGAGGADGSGSGGDGLGGLIGGRGNGGLGGAGGGGREDAQYLDVDYMNAALWRLGKLGEYRAALTMLKQMEHETGHAPNRVSFNLGLEACARSAQAGRAIDLLEGMQSSGIEPNEHSFSSTITACARSGQWELAVELLEEQRRCGVPLTPHSFNAAISACARAGQPDRALALIDIMWATGVEVNVVSYSSAINACARVGNWEKALLLVVDMASKGIEPNEVSPCV